MRRLTFTPNCTDGKDFYNETITKKVREFIEECYNDKYSYTEIKFILSKGFL